MTRSKRNLCIALIALKAILAPVASAQGTGAYLNFESPQVHPIAAAQVDGVAYVIAVNTPDNSVNIGRVDGIRINWIERVAVGLEPVSVLWRGDPLTGGGSFWTCNMLGDSVSRVRLTPGVQGGLEVIHDGQLRVGDEPMSIATLDDGRLVVALGSSSRLVLLESDLSGSPSTVTTLDSSGAFALKEPRRVLSVGGDVLVLDLQGQKDPSSFDLGRYRPSPDGRGLDPMPNALAWPMGTTNFDACRGSDDDELFVVGQDAAVEVIGEKPLSVLETGFVRSVLYRVTAQGVTARDLNRHAAIAPASVGDPVAPDRAVAQPTGILRRVDDKGRESLFIFSFGTDRVLRVTGLTDPQGRRSVASDWRIESLDIERAPGSPNPLAGPRNGALLRATRGSGDRVLVLNRLDNSVALIDAEGFRLLSVTALPNDPTPAHVRAGRRFLYDAKLAPTGMVSCGSCHVDGRLDGLRWDLGGDPSAQDPIDPALFDWVMATPPPFAFGGDKGAMVTQSLQGLVDYEAPLDRAKGELTQVHFTNAPYHWRGDRADFRAFRGAFESLMGHDPQNPGVRVNPVSEADMEVFERFVNSIHYPPNPRQPLDRRYSGELGDPDLPASGSGALRGLKAAHIVRSSGGRSCVQCHALPDGSNNLIPHNNVSAPSSFLSPGNGPGANQQVPLETPGWRGLDRKESWVSTLYGPLVTSPGVATGGVGLMKIGANFDIGRFLQFFQGALDPGATDAFPITANLRDFLSELDSGVAPLVGFHVDFRGSFVGGPAASVVHGLIEAQAAIGNVGVAITLRTATGRRGFARDQSGAAPGYREELGDRRGASLLTLEQVLGFLSDPSDLATVTATPLGSARRIAHLDGAPAPAGSSSVALGLEARVALRPNSASELIPALTVNSDPDDPDPTRRLSASPLPRLSEAIARDQRALGMPVRHEAPRRLRVAGQGIVEGAQLELRGGGGLSLRLPIYATGAQRLVKGRVYRVWTTAVEAAPERYYPWLVASRGRVALRVVNPDGRSAFVGTARLLLEDATP